MKSVVGNVCLFLFFAWEFLAQGVEGTCKLEDVPLDKGFNEKKVVGEWIAWRRFQPLVYEAYNISLHFYHDDNDGLVYTVGRTADTISPCTTVGPIALTPGNERGAYTFFGGYPWRFAEVKHKYLAMYRCMSVGPNGCNEPILSILYRPGGKVPLHQMEKTAERLCPLACLDATTYAYNTGSGCLKNEEK